MRYKQWMSLCGVEKGYKDFSFSSCSFFYINFVNLVVSKKGVLPKHVRKFTPTYPCAVLKSLKNLIDVRDVGADLEDLADASMLVCGGNMRQ
jgi:hypothetical protein